MELSSSSPSPLPLTKPASLPRDAAADQEHARTSLGERQMWQKVKRVMRRNLSGYLFLLPALLVFALFVWYPLILGFIISFQNVDMINPAIWVGWTNYQKVFSDPLFGIAWRNTL